MGPGLWTTRAGAWSTSTCFWCTWDFSRFLCRWFGSESESRPVGLIKPGPPAGPESPAAGVTMGTCCPTTRSWTGPDGAVLRHPGSLQMMNLTSVQEGQTQVKGHSSSSSFGSKVSCSQLTNAPPILSPGFLLCLQNEWMDLLTSPEPAPERLKLDFISKDGGARTDPRLRRHSGARGGRRDHIQPSNASSLPEGRQWQAAPTGLHAAAPL